MRLDKEEHRSLLMRLIDNMPMTGKLFDLNKACVELIDLRNAVKSAKVESQSSKVTDIGGKK